MRYGPEQPEATYVPHAFEERIFDTGEVRLNHAVAGSPSQPALLLIPGQTESWWGYEKAMALLQEHFQIFAVDLRGQGRSTRTPGRYTLDNMGNAVEQVPGRSVEHRRLAGHAEGRAERAARVDGRDGARGRSGRGAAAAPEGVRPRVGARVLDRHGGRELRPRAHARAREGARAFPTMGHSMHGQDPELFARTLLAWAATLPNPV